MKKRTRNILLIVALSTFVIVGGFAVYGVYRLYTFFSWVSSMRPETPAEIKEARVLKGADFLTKSELFKLDKSGIFDTVRKSTGIQDEAERQKFIQMQTAKGIYNFSDLKVIGYEIVAVGKFGAYIFELSGTPKRQVAFDLVKEKIKIGPYEQDHFDSDLDNIRIVRLEKERYGFLSYGSTQGVRVFDQNGHQIWTYGKEDLDLAILTEDEKESQARYEKSTHVQEAAVGDLDNDGISEYIVTRRMDGIRAFDREGKEKWFQPLDHTFFGKLQVIDLDNDGKNELLMVGENIRSGVDGKVIREIKGDSDDAVVIAEDNKKKIVLQFCSIRETRIACVDEKGVKFFDGEAPLNKLKSARPTPEPVPASTPIDNGDGTAAAPGEIYSSYEDTESIYKPRAVWVTLKKDKPKYLAVVGAYIGIPRANLYVYAPDGTLVYHELLPENAETITVLPGENGLESLLIGGKDTIWKYAG